MAIRIITDSAADFSREALAAHNVYCAPLQVTFENETFFDGVTLPGDVFWQRIMSGETPKTSQPTPDTFLALFEDAKAAGDEVVCVLLSSSLSGTMQSALIASSMADYEPIYIVDSLTATIGEQMIVLRACQLRDEGRLTAKEIADDLTAFRSRVKLYASLDTLEYLARGGRIPKAAANIGSLVQLKPLITVSPDGLVAMAGKAIGRHRASEALIKLTGGHVIDAQYPVVPLFSQNHANCEGFVKKLNAAGIACSIEDAQGIGTVIGTHIGPGAYGVAFVEAEG